MVLSASMVFGCINLPGLPGFSELAPRTLFADGDTVEAGTWAGMNTGGINISGDNGTIDIRDT